uniref:DUF221-domain-containing protein n=2 Tax=Kwoniella dejecticola CBS 10117 TaxID=1296121 RepID=A0A1A6AGK3_9TREE|nr:uncharacterized protein I303_01029 [Kwoniella dejecticola CBS 10117]OBR89204.1 hypothetical protein I303_01029 [Kwoniella dejecticola CBS 10117]
MADLSQHTNYTAAYSGLLDNFYLTLAIAGACLIGYEIEVHIPRRRGNDGPFQRIPVRLFHAAQRGWNHFKGKRGREHDREDGRPSSEGLVRDQNDEDRARRRLGDRESWEFGYIFQPKAWAVNPCPPVPRWPLMWIVSSLKVRERDMPEHCGLDLTLHARFLRGAFFYTLLQTIVILPVLMPLHIIYSPSDIAKTSMLRASASSLVKSSGSRWLWVHALLIWWITITWTATVLWITWGGLAYRRRQIKELAVKIAAEREAKRNISRGEEGEDDAASTMDESKGIKRFRTLMVTNIPPDMRDEHILRDYFDYYLQRHHSRKRSPAQTRPQINKPRLSLNGLEMQRHEWTNEESEIDEVILVRKLNTIASLRERRQDVLRKLEIAHVNLAKRVLAAAARHKKSMVGSVATMEKSIGAPLQPGASKTERLGRLVQALDPFLDSNGSAGKMDTTVWDALHALPRELIDPYQSLTHITSLFRDQNAPLIDYLTTKLSYLTMLLDESRSRPLSDYSPSSAAFISFKDARTARLAAKILDSHPKRSLACHAVAAPDWTDILWHRLGKTTYRSEFVRGWVVYLGVWAFTLVWIFPVSLLCALASLTNIAGFIKPLQAFLNAHPKVASAITSLAPVILVALLTIAICPILLVIANKAETIVTRLGIHNSVLERFWKFLMVNGVVFFAIGQSTIEAYLTAFQNKNFDPLPIIASAFPTAAPYFASYILLQTAIQPFFEIFRFGLPTIVYVFGTRLSIIPRQRFSRTEHPTFSHFSQVPQQLLGGAIMHLFMLLNPLVIPFIVWKRQFTYVYGRLYETNGKRTSVRVLRYSLDALALGQFVLFAFFILNKAKGHAIATGILFALTLIAKLIITRALKSRFKSLDIQEADLLCPPVNAPSNGGRNASEDDECEDDSASADWENNDAENAPFDPVSSSRFHTLRRSVGRWAGSWKKAGSSHKPIPFDHVLFSTLDSKISFDPPTTPSTREETQGCDEDMDLPNGQIAEVQQIVVPHHRLEAWEDIPPYYRSRGYDDQPSYTDDYDDFLWLPRDPLSTLDLDDTVEMRVTLTTTAGGTGQIGDLASTTECGEITVRKSEQDTWQDVMNHRAEDERATSPGANSETGLMATPSHIGSEVNDTFSGSHLFRRHTHKAATAWSEVFRRPRASSTNSNPAISLEPIITTNRQDTPSPLLVGGQDGFPTMARVSTPSAMSERQDSDPDQEETLTPAEPPSGSHISFAATLGRSPSGRRPTRLRSNSSNRSGGGPLTSPTTARNRSLSHLSPQRSRTASAMSAQQQLLWDEVMREETLARHEDIQEERAEMEKEKEEVIKEQDKMRKASLSGSVEGGGLRRRLTRGNSEGSRPRLERAGDSARSRNGSVALVETPSSVEHTS